MKYNYNIFQCTLQNSNTSEKKTDFYLYVLIKVNDSKFIINKLNISYLINNSQYQRIFFINYPLEDSFCLHRKLPNLTLIFHYIIIPYKTFYKNK